MLKDDVNSYLSQDRIAAMTAEDVPNMVTPVAASLKEARPCCLYILLYFTIYDIYIL